MNGVVPLLKFTPSAQDPEALEAITVQREQLIGKLVDVALDADGSARHQLLIGPRGIGKTHILSLVASRIAADTRGRQIAVAWLEEDPWAITSYQKLLAAIIAQVASERSDSTLAETAGRLRALRDETGHEAEQALRDALGKTRLVLLVENLDEIFRRIDVNGQERLRAFIENWGQMVVLATAPQLFEGIQLHESPFYGFFAITHLEELNLESATELMRRVAELRNDVKLVEFLATETAKRRLVAIEALAGGHPRIWILLSGCVSIKAIDELVPLFMEALDDLTPYYQDRLRELSDQQQELIVLMSESGGALSNRELAERSGLPQNQVATILKQLTDRGYIRRAEVPSSIAGGDARMSYWELREPLMRLCLDVKQSRGKPLRMLVEFLRAWYGVRLLDELALLPASAPLAGTYVREAFRTLDEVIPAEDLLHGSAVEILTRAELGLSVTPKRSDLRFARAAGLLLKEEFTGARDELESLIADAPPKQVELGLKVPLAIARQALGEAIDADSVTAALKEFAEGAPDDGEAQMLAAVGLMSLGRFEESLEVFPRALELAPDNAHLLCQYGNALSTFSDRHSEALAAFVRAIELEPENPSGHYGQGLALLRLGRSREALAPSLRATELDPDEVTYQEHLGDILSALDRNEEALAAFSRAIELDPESAKLQQRLGATYGSLGNYQEALQAFEMAEEFGSKNPFVYLNMAGALVLLGRREEALLELQKGVERGPNEGELYGPLGVLLAELGRTEDAEKAFERAMELEPTNGEHPNRLAIALRSADRLREAEHAARGAVERDMDDPAYRFTVAEIALARGRGHKAVGLLREALTAWNENGRRLGPGDTDFVCGTLWSTPAGVQRTDLVDEVVAAYGDAGAAKWLGLGLVRTVRSMADPEVNAEMANAWAMDWRAAHQVDDLAIPLKLLEAAAKWKKDRDRSHLLDLPPEQREILVDLLDSNKSSALDGE